MRQKSQIINQIQINRWSKEVYFEKMKSEQGLVIEQGGFFSNSKILSEHACLSSS
jgi:hypothetical protein